MVGGSGPEFQHRPPEGGARHGGKEGRLGLGREGHHGQDGVNEKDMEIKEELRKELEEEEGVSHINFS